MAARLNMPAVDELSLPCQPRVLALLMRELLSDAPHLRRVNQLFGGDPILAAHLMACANAQSYQMPAGVRGIPQAITLLGERQLRALLQKAQAGLASRGTAGVDMAQFTRLSLDSAKLARTLAVLSGLDASAAYVAALLHGIGQILLHQSQAPGVAALDQEMAIWDPRRPRLELRTWGYSASTRTAALLRQSNCPADMVAAMEAMDAPMASEYFDPMAGVLHLAAWCSRAKHSGWSERSKADAFPVDVALALGIDVNVVLQQEAPDWSQSLY